MRPIRAVLIDIDGVLTVSWQPLPGGVAALHRLRAVGVPLALVTNTTSRTRASIASALAEAGFPVTASDVLTAPVITAAYLQDRYPGARCLLLNSGDIAPAIARGDSVKGRPARIVMHRCDACAECTLPRVGITASSTRVALACSFTLAVTRVR